MKAIFIQPQDYTLTNISTISEEYLKMGWDILYIIIEYGKQERNPESYILEGIKNVEIKKEITKTLLQEQELQLEKIEKSPEILKRAQIRLEKYIKEGRITITEGDITEEIYKLPKNYSDHIFWTNFIDYLNTLNTTDMHKCFSQLHKIQKQDSVFGMTNIIYQEDYPEGSKSTNMLMDDNIKSIISKYFEPVCEQSSKIFKENTEFNSMSWIFKKN